MAVEVEPSHQYSATFFAMWQITAEAQSDKTVTDMEIHVKKSWVTEFLYAEKKKLYSLTFSDAYWTFMETTW